jgi:hypothetical protein
VKPTVGGQTISASRQRRLSSNVADATREEFFLSAFRGLKTARLNSLAATRQPKAEAVSEEAARFFFRWMGHPRFHEFQSLPPSRIRNLGNTAQLKLQFNQTGRKAAQRHPLRSGRPFNGKRL